MSTRALTLAIRLLTAAAVSVPLLSFQAGCLCGDPWSKPAEFQLETEADLEAVVLLGYEGVLVATAAGEIIRASTDVSLAEPALVHRFVVHTNAAPLHALLAHEGDVWAAGDDGTLVHRPADPLIEEADPWKPIDLGTDARLLSLGRFERGGKTWLVAAGEGVVRVVELETGEVSTPPTPEGGWGELRTVFEGDGRIYVAGAGGVAWSCEDPSGAWTAAELGLGGRDINGGGPLDRWSTTVAVAVAEDGRYALLEDGVWRTVDSKVDSDFVAYAPGLVLARDGRVYELLGDGTLDRLTRKAEGLNRGLAFDGNRAVVVGADGRGRELSYSECIGGRPFVVDGQARTAAAVERLDWCAEPREPELDDASASPELAAELAALWTRDGLYEHASVASFAKFTLELMGLGAPPELLAEAQRAALDEIDHAQRCFALARRYGASAAGPGPIAPAASEALSPDERGPVDPVRVTLALFEDGCVNESLAACEAAVAAAGCRVAEVRATLERIAADERRHAVFAWRCLGWLIETYGERVAGPLREHLRRRGPGPRPAADRTRSSAAELRAHGRLDASERARIHARVYREAVWTLCASPPARRGPALQSWV